mgnify:FL=1
MQLYRIAISLFAPATMGLFALRSLQGSESRDALRERIGRPTLSETPTLWMHGASNGELHSARPLIQRLRDARPDLEITVTTNTVTGRDMVNSWGMPHVRAFCAPLDLRNWTSRFLKARQVVALISLENELWPNRIRLAARAGMPVFLVAAKISRKSARVWKRLPALRKEMFQSIALLAPQDRGSRNRFKALGVREDQFAPIIELKSLYTPVDTVPPPLPFARDQIWLAASTHEGEEALIIQAHKERIAAGEHSLLLLAPRHPRRAADIRALIEGAGLSVAQRSQQETVTPDTQVYLVDTMGEMPMWYRAAGATFVAGSFAAKGGHTPFEPAAYGTAILHGPDTSNFRRIYRDLDTAQAALPVQNASDLATAVTRALSDRSSYAQRATKVLQASTDLDPLVDRILERLPPANVD